MRNFRDALSRLVLGLAEEAMEKSDIEPGGDWYDSRVELEDFVKKAGFDCEVTPGDYRVGPKCIIKGKDAVLMLSQDPGTYILEVGGQYIKIEDRTEFIDAMRGRDETSK